MAFNFNGTTEYYQNSAVLASPPMTFAAWFNCDQNTGAEGIVATGQPGSTDYHVLQVNGNVGGDPIRAGSSTGTFRSATSSTGYTVGQWHHGAASFDSSSPYRQVWLDGGSKGTDTSANVATTPTVTEIGRRPSGSPVEFNGRIAEVGIWDVVLTDAEVAMLAAGFAPPFVRPESLVCYVPLDGAFIDVKGGNWTENGTPNHDDSHPRIIRPSAKILPFVAPVGGGSFQPAWAMNSTVTIQ